MHKRKGFTLVELLIVIVVIAILAAISVVAYSGISQRSNTAKVASVIDAYVKLLQMYKTDNGEFPTYSDTGGNSACLTSTGSMPASGPFPENACQTQYVTVISPELNDKLSEYTATLPDGQMPVVQFDTNGYSRGLKYNSDGGYYSILYEMNGTYTCPRGSTFHYQTVANTDATECYFEVDYE